MNDEPSAKTKTEVIDLIINFLIEHEKQMDQTLQRLERLIEALSERNDHLEHEPTTQIPAGLRLNAFTLTITNPSNFDKMKSLKIEWRTKQEVVAEMNDDSGVNIRKIEHPIGKD